jgi:dTDP-4-dehydrorhamnose reductase
MNIVLLGKDGQVGHALSEALPDAFPDDAVTSLGRQHLDLQDSENLRQVLQSHAPDIIINAAAYTAVDQAEREPDIAMRVNAVAVQTLADFARANDALLVHYSTDYVFDGEKPEPYVEGDATHPLNVYGRSKRQGEIAILESGCRALIFRTSWVFSIHGANFIKTVLRLAQERDKISIVADQIGAPTSAKLIASTTARALSSNLEGGLDDGLYHLTASGETSWRDLAAHIVQRLCDAGKPPRLLPQNIEGITTEQYPLPAKRPKNSRLDTGTLSAALHTNFLHWSEHVNCVVDRLTETEL